MRRTILILCALIATTLIYAQTEVTVGVTRGKEYGVTYLLPKTEIELTLQATKHTYTPGEFCKYADHYLRLRDVSAEPNSYWELNKVEVRVVGVPDKEHTYFVKMKDKSIAPLMELTENGIVRSINMPFSGIQTSQPVKEKKKIHIPNVDPRNFLTEEILMANSSAKMAELIAKEIYSIRESKNTLLRGEAENMPQDGAQLKIMIDNLTMQEKAMTEMFSGTTKTESETVVIRLTPEEMKNNVIARFSKKLGIVDSNNLAGEPFYLTITNLETPQIPNIVDEKKKELDGVVYNVPGRGHISLMFNHKKLFEEELPLTQFGCTEFLAPVLFNKNSTTKVLFDVNTGGILKVDRGE